MRYPEAKDESEARKQPKTNPSDKRTPHKSRSLSGRTKRHTAEMRYPGAWMKARQENKTASQCGMTNESVRKPYLHACLYIDRTKKRNLQPLAQTRRQLGSINRMGIKIISPTLSPQKNRHRWRRVKNIVIRLPVFINRPPAWQQAKRDITPYALMIGMVDG